jgi:hypothetical protein
MEKETANTAGAASNVEAPAQSLEIERERVKVKFSPLQALEALRVVRG